MTSQERREARYQRRRSARELKRASSNTAFDKVFSYQNIFNAGITCSKGVKWKSSTQTYLAKLPTNSYRTWRDLKAGTYKSKGFHEFVVFERGKTRLIKSVHISERVVQKVLCEQVLVPLHTKSFIFDNGASQKNKGMDFSVKRLKIHLRRHFRHYGTGGYALLFDFKDFFGSAPHKPIYEANARVISDERTLEIANRFMEDFGEIGLGLGSQVSQTYALLVSNGLDHFIKEVLRVKGYGRYMDDGYLLSDSKEELQDYLKQIVEYTKAQGLTLSMRKTRISPIATGFKFLKTKFTLSETGKVYVKMNSQCTSRIRNKIRKLVPKVYSGELAYEDVLAAFMSYLGHMRRGDSYNKIKQMEAYFYGFFNSA
jgi:hypothetical protein